MVICKNFFWDGRVILNRFFFIVWDNMCYSKREGGLGMKDYEMWYLVIIGKFVWDVVFKAEKMWMKWVNYIIKE